MIEKITAIVIDITRHNDKHNVVTLYSRSRGRLSFLSSVGSGKAGKLRQARLQPLAVVDADINFKPNAELQKLGSFSLHNVWTDIYFHPMKRMMILFLSEFLNKLLRASMPDPSLWDYLYQSISLLDNTEGNFGNFNIAFLSSLLPFAGIQPDPTKYNPGYIFNMQTGNFTPDFLEADFLPSSERLSYSQSKGYILRGDEAKIAALLCRINFFNVRILKLDRTSRYNIIQKLLQYYSIHFPGSGNLKSLEILHDLLS